MTRNSHGWTLGLWAIGGVPVVFWFFVYLAYQIFLPRGRLPFHSIAGETIFFFVFGLCLVSGVLAIVFLPYPNRWLRIVAGVAYLVAMSGVLFAMGLFAACAGGDCL